MSVPPVLPGPVRADVVTAATQVFSRLGYHGASMADVAAELGMRKASLYHHVRRKEDLLYAIHEQLIDRLVDETLAITASADSADTKLRRLLSSAMALVADHRDAVNVFLRESHTMSGERWDALVARRDFYEQMVGRVIAGGTAAGDFADVPPDIAARGVLAMANWCHTWFRPDGSRSAEEIAGIFADIALDGLRTR